MASVAEITASLTMEDIPIKLRCAACNRLANNAFRMPCCDQSICEDCQESLPQACPVCLHEPVIKDDCRPNKALRTTVKAFLKRKGIELETARKKEAGNVTANASIATEPSKSISQVLENDHIPAEAPTASNTNDVKIKDDPERAPQDQVYAKRLSMISLETGSSNDVQKDIPKMSIESPDPQTAPPHSFADANSAPENIGADQQHRPQDSSVMGQNAQWNMQNTAEAMFGNSGMGFDNMNGGFPNVANMGNFNGMSGMNGMGFNGAGDFNQMMQLMQSGMANNMMGSFPNAMGMPGMNMDPSAMSQGMFGGFGGPGMGMNGMNGMNMGMNFDAGQNSFGGFNGQPHTQNSFGGHVDGNYAANSGYGGYNMPQHQGNFNQMHQHQNFNHDFQHGPPHQGIQYRGRGRGRGQFFNAGRGRGYNQNYQGRQANSNTSQNQEDSQPVRRGSPVYTPMINSTTETAKAAESRKVEEVTKLEYPASNKPVEHDQAAKTLASEHDPDTNKASEAPKEDEKSAEPDSENKLPSLEKQTLSGHEPPAKIEEPVPVHSVLSNESTIVVQEALDSTAKPASPTAMSPPPVRAIPTGPASQRGEYPSMTSPRGRGFGRGYFRGAPDQRAMSGTGRGSFPSKDSSSQPLSSLVGQALPSPTEPRGLGVEGAPKGPKALLQGLPNAGVRSQVDTGFSIVGRASAASQAEASGRRESRSASPVTSRSRSQVRDRSSRHKGHRHRSGSGSRDRRRNRHYDRRDSQLEDLTDYNESSRVEVEGNRDPDLRENSVDSLDKRSSRRQHREHARESSGKHRSHRSHREREGSRSREKDHRSSRKKSKTPDLRINGASRMEQAFDHSSSVGVVADQDDHGYSSKRRRDREEDAYRQDRKKSRREGQDYYNETPEIRNSKHGRRSEREAKSHVEKPSGDETRAPQRTQSPPRGPKVDQHALEREARNRERQMKEIQRRALMEGKGPSGGRSKLNGRPGDRRHSYKYEDEDLASGVERERESGRWR